MKELGLNEIHEETLSLLKKIIEICEKLNIRYYFAYGSLIGVVRHKGFIPWDDDLDIQMLRPDYDVFFNYCLAHEKDLYPYKLLCLESEPDYPYSLPRFSNLEFRLKTKMHKDIKMGVFIDIYVLDGVGNEDDNYLKPMKKKNMIRRFLLQAIRPSCFDHDRSFFQNMKTLPIFLFSHALGKDYFIKKLNSMKDTYSYDDSEYVGVITWDSSLKRMKKMDYINGTTGLFNNIQVSIPNNWDKILRDEYGDYMVLPPKEKQKPTHNYKLYRL